MIKNKLININKNILKKKKFLKNEIKKNILKSIIQNKNLEPIKRSYSFFKLSRYKYNYSISKQKTNICIFSGKFKSNFKKYDMSRHRLKKISYSNEIQNTKIINW